MFEALGALCRADETAGAAHIDLAFFSNRLTRAFVNAAMTGTLEELSAMLHDDVVLTSDGGAERYAARRPVVGAQRVSRFLHNLAARRPPGTEVVFVEVNGLPGVVLTFGGEPVIVQELRWDEGRLCEINAVSNPDKLRGVTQDLARRSRPTTLLNPSS